MLNSDQSHSSQTQAVINHIAMHGTAPSPDETDHRDLPSDDAVEHTMTGLFDTLIDLALDTQIEDDLEELLWSITNVFHRRLL